MNVTNALASRLALGTVQFGLPYGVANQAGQVEQSAIKVVLDLAFENGIEMLDTAITYGCSEVSLGQAGIQDFKVVTKLPAVPDDCNDINNWIYDQFYGSLDRLGVNNIYGFLLHQPTQLLESNGKQIFQTLQSLKETQQVEKIGISIYSPKELDLLCSRYRFDLVQAPFNLVDRRLHKSGWLQRLKDSGIEIHTRSAFLQGLLLMCQSAIPHKYLPWRSLFDQWHIWLANEKISAVHACLAFSLVFPEIDHVIVGVDSVNQFKDILNVIIDDMSNDFPDIQCDDEDLINPSRWSKL